MIFPTLIRALGTANDVAALPAAEVKALQERKLRRLLSYAYSHSEFYYRTFTEAGITEENIETTPITEFPVVTKKELMANYSTVLTDGGFTQEELRDWDESGNVGLFRKNWHVVHSSGSTDTPKYYVYDKKAWNALVVGAARSALWGMSRTEIATIGMGRARVLYAGVPGSNFGSSLMVGEACKTIHAKQLSLDIREPLSTWGEKVKDFQPNILLGYPSAIKILADRLQEEDIHLPVKRIISCGEGLSGQLRKHLEESFGAPIVNFYAASESLALGVATDSASGMVLFDDMNYLEKIDGKLYITCLYNYTQPIIRYYLSDSMELMPPAESGCGFTRGRLMCGRDDDVLWFTAPDGKKNFIHAVQVENFLIDHLLDYQLRQESDDSFTIYTVVDAGAKRPVVFRELYNQVAAVLDERKMDYVNFNIRFVPAIEPDPNTGKRKVCLDLRL